MRFGVSAEDLTGARRTERFGRLMEFETARARRYYQESAALRGMVEPDSQAALWAMIQIYSRLLEHIHASPFDVLARRISLSPAEKLWIVLRAFVGWT